MKVMVLSTQAGADLEWLRGSLSPLDLDDLDLVLVVVTKPAERLPVRRCIVVGRSLRPRRAVREAPVRGRKPQRQPAGRRARLARSFDRRFLALAPPRLSKNRRMMLTSGVAWSADVRREFAAADMVIATDSNATSAAWTLARRIPGPEVVYEADGAVRKLAELDSLKTVDRTGRA